MKALLEIGKMMLVAVGLYFMAKAIFWFFVDRREQQRRSKVRNP